MKIVEIKSLNIYINFINSIYKNTPHYKDNKISLLKLTSKKNSAFYKNSKQWILGVDNNGLKCVSILIRHKNNPDTLYFSFFEALENTFDEFDLLMEITHKKAKELNCKNIFYSINGHCNYSVGFLASDYASEISFGQIYNPEYYLDYFEKYKFIKHEFSIFRGEIENLNKRLLNLSKNYCNYKIKSFADFNHSMKIFTDLNNEIFDGHFYYYIREYAEDKELFKEMWPLLHKESLLIGYDGDTPIGFLLWYPNYNEFVNYGESAGIKTFLKYKFLKHKFNSFIIAEMGVLEKYKKSGLVLAMLNHLLEIRNRDFPNAELGYSGWISNENRDSYNLAKLFYPEKSKGYIAYEQRL